MVQIANTLIVCCVLCATVVYGYATYTGDPGPAPVGIPEEPSLEIPPPVTSSGTLADLRIRTTVSPPERARVGDTLHIYGDIYNYAPTATIVPTDCDILITNTTEPVRLGRNTVTWRGTTMYSLVWDKNTYAPWQWWSRNTTFVPTVPGVYRICTVADRLEELPESNESNNALCKEVRVEAI